jgi:hypothetical protein
MTGSPGRVLHHHGVANKDQVNKKVLVQVGLKARVTRPTL